MPNTERAHELLDDDRNDEPVATCFWCGVALPTLHDDAFCSPECEASAQAFAGMISEVQE